jgi:bile acid-coenzyme A ligase
MGELMICDETGNEVPPGALGEIWHRSGRKRQSYRYVGASARVREDGWESLGDMGWVDEDGYLYLSGCEEITRANWAAMGPEEGR